MHSIIALLCFVHVASAKTVLFGNEDGESSLHPRTFFLTDEQENEVIQRAVCEDLDCPDFTVERDHPHYIQQRRYREANFLFSSHREQCNLTATLELALDKLTEYRQGANTQNKLYSDTLPVLVQVDQFDTVRSNNPWCRMGYSVGLYTPHYWGIPAAPHDAALKFRKIKEGFTVYVDTFTGSVEDNLLRELGIFRKNLDDLKLCNRNVRFYLALYDIGSLRPASRHEIWLKKC